jgi:hypothetical protein
MTDYLWTKRRFNDASGLGSESTSPGITVRRPPTEDSKCLGTVTGRKPYKDREVGQPKNHNPTNRWLMSGLPPTTALEQTSVEGLKCAIRRHTRCNKTLPGALHENDANSSSCAAAAPSGDATGQNFVNAATIEIDHLETPTVSVKSFADFRQVPELTEHETGGGMIAAVRRQ